MQIPILNGIYSDEVSDFRVNYPRNMVPVPVPQGISNGYLRYAEGLQSWGDEGPGVGRGGINWSDVCYRVMGSKLTVISSQGQITELGDVKTNDRTVSMDYSFDRLAIGSSGNLYYYSDGVLSQVTDPDLGTVVDLIWVDGYFMTTDGEFLIVTELDDPFAINPLKYGSSEVDPDPIKALLKLRNEPHALNRYTIEVFDNVGGTGFPFQRIDGAQITKGVIGTHMCGIFLEAIAFVGGGRNESISVWLAAGGSASRIATREIDQILAKYSDSILERSLLEVKVGEGHQHLFIHLPDETLVYDASATQIAGQPVWHVLSSGLEQSQYRGQNLVWCYNKWLVDDPKSYLQGYLTKETSKHWGELVGWEFSTAIVYNEGNGAIFHELELVALAGRSDFGADSTIQTQYSVDGETWSMPKTIKAGKRGQRNKRLVWLNQGPMRHWRTQRFQGTGDAKITVARLEARLEPLVV